MLCRYVATHRRSRLVRYMARKCARFLECYESADEYDFDRNGERFVLETLGRRDMECILDVGANVGDWTAMALKFCPGAKVHCFEIMPSVAEELRGRMAAFENVVVNDVGMSDEAGKVKLKYFPEVSTITTMTDYPHEFDHVHVTGRVTTGDAYVQEHGIERVGFLKLDVEGAERLVLVGFEKAFSERRIDVVQFEYGKVSILTKYMLRDFHALLSEWGLVVGKIYPDYVEFREYDFSHEDFRGSNFLAVRKELRDVMDSLG